MSVTVIRYPEPVSRWEPNAAGRLSEAALELYLERGFEQTTVAEIAERAGLSERTFFRHFSDKREVLFAGSSALNDHLIHAVADALPSIPPLEVVALALESTQEIFEGRRDFARKRQAVIAATPELQERELIKLATLGAAMAGALRERGVAEPVASLTAEAGIAVFRVAFERWITGPKRIGLAQRIRESLDELKAVTAGA